MRRNRMTFFMFLMAVLLGTLLSFSCMMCLQDAFALDGDPLLLLTVCGGASVLAAVAVGLKRSWILTAAVFVLEIGFLFWNREVVIGGCLHTVYRITSEYAACYTAVQILGQEGSGSIWVLAALAIPLAWLMVWIVGREGSVVLVILACMPVLLLCLVIVDLAPVLWLILMTGGLLVLLVSQHIRERSAEEGSLLAWWLVLPTIIFLSAVTVLWPPADYQRADWSEVIRAAAEAKVTVQNWQAEYRVSGPKWDRELKEVDLSRIGPKLMTGTQKLEYRTDRSVSYLRGVSLAIYDNNSWSALDSAVYRSGGVEETPLRCAQHRAGTLEIRTHSREPLLYTAYDLHALPDGALAVDDAYVENTKRVTEYAVDFGSASTGVQNAYAQLVWQRYLQIPQELQVPLAEIVSEAGLVDGSADAVADFVRSSGTYDLNTPRLPVGEDFVLYFLEESHRGYCVHFATATVMLLRSVGIPARYVTGYSVSGEAGQWTQVTENDAHAWVEYYINGQGWLPLDPTPAAEPEQDPAVPEEQPSADGPSPEEDPAEPVPDTEETKSPEIGWEVEQPDVHEGRVNVWWSLLAVPMLMLLLPVRRWFVLYIRKGRCRKGPPNRRALALWRWLAQLSGVQQRPVSEDLLALAEKARFSQHTLEETELALLQQAVDASVLLLKSAPTVKRLWYRYGLVLY